MPGKRRYLIAFLVAGAAVGVTVGLAKLTRGTAVKTLPTEIKEVETATKAGAAQREGNALGATNADWNAGHAMDRNYDVGAAYDPMDGLSNGATHRFSSVIHSEGHVTSFYLAFPPNTSIRQAVDEAMSVVPRDATHGPVVTHAECATITIHSATLQGALGSPDAKAFFGEGTSYNPAAVTGVEIEAGASKMLESETGC
jgi:hypothetical protein